MQKKYLQLMKEFFEKHEMRYALIGGLALNSYGYNRFTNDVDFLTDQSNSEKIISYLDSLGFKLLQNDSAFSLHVLFNERIDMMYVEGETADKILDSTRKQAVDELEIQVISPIYLAMLKGFSVSQDSSRIRDLDDIKELYLRKLISKEDVEFIAKKYKHEKYFSFILDNQQNSKGE